LADQRKLALAVAAHLRDDLRRPIVRPKARPPTAADLNSSDLRPPQHREHEKPVKDQQAHRYPALFSVELRSWSAANLTLRWPTRAAPSKIRIGREGAKTGSAAGQVLQDTHSGRLGHCALERKPPQ
jgi:hypothetical protein